jgi:hypothetical protein
VACRLITLDGTTLPGTILEMIYRGNLLTRQTSDDDERSLVFFNIRHPSSLSDIVRVRRLRNFRSRRFATRQTSAETLVLKTIDDRRLYVCKRMNGPTTGPDFLLHSNKEADQ